MKTDRLISVLLYLLSHQKVTARELGTHFSVSLRTIYRDMEALGHAGVPIVSTQGVEGGYGLVESYTIDRAFFKEEELTSIFSTLNGVNAAIKDKALQDVLLKLKALSARDGTARDRAEVLPPVVYAPLPWGMGSDGAANLETLRRAVERRRLLVFTYTKSAGDGAPRTVEPISLVLQAGTWYLYAWDRDKADYRFFRLSRISAVCVKPVSFRRKPGRRPFPWETGWDSEPPISIRLVFSARAAQKARDAFAWSTPEQRPDGSLLIDLISPYGDWVDSQILSFGPEVEVIDPVWLRERVGKLAAEAAHLYSSDVREKKPPQP